MSLITSDKLQDGLSFPRVSGDEPVRFMTLMTPTVFSPRERG